PCPRHPRLAVDDDALAATEPALDEGRRGEHRAHRITARIGHERRRGDGLAVKFGQPVHGFRKPYRIDVIGLVPSAVECGIAQSVVRGEVDDLAPLPAQDGHGAYGLEYWNLERAPGWPYFLRSLMRGSRVRSPARLRVGRRLTSNSRRARAMP